MVFSFVVDTFVAIAFVFTISFFLGIGAPEMAF
jgi:hypothetical protein